ncbi:conserved hypothetical protein [Ricinus communis]|uniref:Uncharacterized protein n=1 Tax=Ricinus communis TaxID=3988 RepID=B9S2G5_RICCO|nr:conserved hypothetical protein [Ricinus communis]
MAFSERGEATFFKLPNLVKLLLAYVHTPPRANMRIPLSRRLLSSSKLTHAHEGRWASDLLEFRSSFKDWWTDMSMLIKQGNHEDRLMCWKIWTARNSLLFQEKRVPLERVAAQARELWVEYKEAVGFIFSSKR